MGGSAALHFFPAHAARQKPTVCRGEVSLGPGKSLYINRGLGHLIQARFNVRPEVTVWNLVQAGKA